MQGEGQAKDLEKHFRRHMDDREGQEKMLNTITQLQKCRLKPHCNYTTQGLKWIKVKW